MVIPVDELRLWVKSGLSESVPWTEETEAQFLLAEAAAAKLAAYYQDAGYAVIVDHCRNLPTLERTIQAHLSGRNVVKVCLMPDLNENLRRNRERTNKSFGHELLIGTIEHTNRAYRDGVPEGWLVIDNTKLPVEKVHAKILEYSLRKIG